jgi:hypothetical protein
MLREEFLGTWTLVSFEGIDLETSEKRYPLGPDAVGLIMYTEDGYMSAQIMRPDRSKYTVPDVAGGGTQEEAAAAAHGYLAYSGPFSVDESGGVIHHEVTVSLVPDWVGAVEPRDAVFENGRMILSAEQKLPGKTEQATLVWRRR